MQRVYRHIYACKNTKSAHLIKSGRTFTLMCQKLDVHIVLYKLIVMNEGLQFMMHFMKGYNIPILLSLHQNIWWRTAEFNIYPNICNIERQISSLVQVYTRTSKTVYRTPRLKLSRALLYIWMLCYGNKCMPWYIYMNKCYVNSYGNMCVCL